MLLVTALLAGCTSPDQELAPASVPTPETTTPAPVASKAPVTATPAPKASPEPTTPAPTTPHPPKPDPLAVTVTAPGSAATGAPVPIAAEPDGGKGTPACAWSGGDFADPKACETTVMFLEAGAHEIMVTVTAGQETVEKAVTVEAGLFVPSEDVVASRISVYMAVGAIPDVLVEGPNTVLGAAGEETLPPPVPAGQDVSVQARFIDPAEGAAVSTDIPVAFLLLDSNGSVVEGPLEEAVAIADEGTPPSCSGCVGFAYDWTIPADFPAGIYYLAFLADVDGTGHWVKDERDDGYSRIEIVAPPA